jgi:phosphonate transport system ATP-binding protein
LPASARHGALAFALEEVSLAFDGLFAFEGISFDVAPGEVVALVGPSGAGKTSVLRLMNGVLQPTRGRVLAGGRELGAQSAAELRALRRSIGVVPQSFALVPNLRVAQNVIAGRLGRMGLLRSLRAVVRPGRRELEEIHALLEELGIEDKLFQRVDSLSGGEQQRVAIARALYQEPGALLADEPLSALDPARARETLGLLVRVAQERRLTLVLSLHDIVLAREVIPRLVGLRSGRILFDRPTEAIDDAEIEELYGLEQSGGLAHG